MTKIPIIISEDYIQYFENQISLKDFNKEMINEILKNE